MPSSTNTGKFIKYEGEREYVDKLEMLHLEEDNVMTARAIKVEEAENCRLRAIEIRNEIREVGSNVEILQGQS